MGADIENSVQSLPHWRTDLPSLLFWTFCFALAFLTSFWLSGLATPSLNIDDSYQASLEYGLLHQFQFGQDIAFTFGPLGFLFSSVSQGYFLKSRILFAVFFGLMTSWSVVGLTRSIPGALKFVFLGWFVFFAFKAAEVSAFLIIIYSGTVLMRDITRHFTVAALYLLMLGALALVSFTLFIAATLAIGICIVVNLYARQIKSVQLIAVGYLAVVSFFWLVTGQRLENFWSWLRISLVIANGYTEAMTLVPQFSVVLDCVIAGILFLVGVALVLRSTQLTIRITGLILVTIVCLFLSWKHGFVRADDHVLAFINFLPVAFSFLLIEPIQKTLAVKSRRYLALLYLGGVLFCALAAGLYSTGATLDLYGQAQLIAKLMSTDWQDCFAAVRTKQQNRYEPDLPIVRSLVGNSSVDVLNYGQWGALGNNLNYRPRPINQSYAAYSEYLQGVNLDYYRGGNRPRHVLMKMETIDNRFPTLDDAMVLTYLLINYAPVAVDGDFLLLRSAPEPIKTPRFFKVHEQSIQFGETLDLRNWKHTPLLMQVNIEPTFVGRLIKLLYQAPVVSMQAAVDGTLRNYRFIPAMARGGFIASPLLADTHDLRNQLLGLAGKYLDMVSFSRPQSSYGQLYDTINIVVYEMK